MTTAKEVLLATANVRNVLSNIDIKLNALMGSLNILVEWTNSQGMVRESATLYKLISDTDYLLHVAPGMVRSVEVNAEALFSDRTDSITPPRWDGKGKKYRAAMDHVQLFDWSFVDRDSFAHWYANSDWDDLVAAVKEYNR